MECSAPPRPAHMHRPYSDFPHTCTFLLQRLTRTCTIPTLTYAHTHIHHPNTDTHTHTHTHQAFFTCEREPIRPACGDHRGRRSSSLHRGNADVSGTAGVLCGALGRAMRPPQTAGATHTRTHLARGAPNRCAFPAGKGDHRRKIAQVYPSCAYVLLRSR